MVVLFCDSSHGLNVKKATFEQRRNCRVPYVTRFFDCEVIWVSLSITLCSTCGHLGARTILFDIEVNCKISRYRYISYYQFCSTTRGVNLCSKKISHHLPSLSSDNFPSESCKLGLFSNFPFYVCRVIKNFCVSFRFDFAILAISLRFFKGPFILFRPNQFVLRRRF